MAINRKAWCDEAVSHIRFKPDRKAVREELVAHIQDRSDDLVSRGFSREQADNQALHAMGDPEEVGRQLDAVHKPWLGWLWVASRWLAVLAAAALLRCLLFGGGFFNWYPNYLGYQTYLDPEVDVLQTEHYGELHRSYYWEGDGKTAKWDRYTFRIEKAALWDNDLYASMMVSGFLPWEDDFVLSEAYAVDDLGNLYQNIQSISFDDERYEESGWKLLNLGRGACRTLTTWWYDFYIWGFDPEAQWVELRYERAGRNIVLRIDLTGGEVT